MASATATTVAGISLFLMAHFSPDVQAFLLPLTSSILTKQRDVSLSLSKLREEQNDIWTMEEDWALLDQLPKFTVGEDSNARTFWTQLSAATPTLINKDVTQLKARCRHLDANYTLVYGPSPPLLQNWQIDFDHRDGKAVGQTEDGRTIWLRYHIFGRLKGDPLSDMSSSVISLVPGGYIEAIGGRIYELGLPLNNAPWDEDHESQFQHQGKDVKEPQRMEWWLHATTSTMSALVASTLLSACIGYAAGLSMISEEASSHHVSDMAIAAKKSELSVSKVQNEPSIAERRARAEYRILREERLIQQISDKLAKDKIELNILRDQEQQWATPNQLLP